jgi:mRNA interferase MazF
MLISPWRHRRRSCSEINEGRRKEDEMAEEPEAEPAQPSILIGDVFMVDWSPGRGSERAGLRPAVIVQNNALNSNPRFPNTIVVAVSRSGRPVPTHVEVPQDPDNGLSAPVSYIRCEQILTVAKGRLQQKLGRITPTQRAAVSRALKRLLSLI